MKKSSILGTLALFLVWPSFSWGQTNTPAPAQNPQVSARILLNAKKYYSKGEEVVLEITLENTGKTPLRFHNRNIEFFYEIEVAAGEKKLESSLGFEPPQFSGFFFTLHPQNQLKGYLYLSRAFDLSKQGLYTVKVSRQSRQAEVEGIFTITSQPLDFKVDTRSTFGHWEGVEALADPIPSTSPADQPSY